MVLTCGRIMGMSSAEWCRTGLEAAKRETRMNRNRRGSDMSRTMLVVFAVALGVVTLAARASTYYVNPNPGAFRPRGQALRGEPRERAREPWDTGGEWLRRGVPGSAVYAAFRLSHGAGGAACGACGFSPWAAQGDDAARAAHVRRASTCRGTRRHSI